MTQLLVNTVYTSHVFVFLAFAVMLNYKGSKSINLVFASYIPLGAYLFGWFMHTMGLHGVLAWLLTVAILLSWNLLLERLLLLKLLKQAQNRPYISLIGSLGLYIVMTEFITWIWGGSHYVVLTSNSGEVHNFLGGTLSLIQLLFMLTAVFFILICHFWQRISLFNTMLKAVSENRSLSRSFGISFDHVHYTTSSICTFFCVTLGVFTSLDTGVNPSLGFNLFMYGFTIIIIGGNNSLLGTLLGGILLASCHHLTAYFWHSKWIELVSYVVLLLLLIIRPHGLRGSLTKKNSI